MKWIIHPRVFDGAKDGVPYVCALVDRYDKTLLREVRIKDGAHGGEAVIGHCYRPTRANPWYRIRATVTQTWPATVPCLETARQAVPLRLISLDEAVVFIITHELYHFLVHTKQITGVETEWQADTWARSHVEAFRASFEKIH